MIHLPFFRSNGERFAGRRFGKLLEIAEGDQIFTERIRALRAMVEQRTDLHQLKLIGVTSSIAGEGKTSICAHLATSLAATGRKKILLVDMDVRKGDLTSGMGRHRSPGLTDYILGGATLQQILRPTECANLFLVTRGAEVSSPPDLLAGDSFKTFIREIRERFDTTIFDTPPVLAVADTVTVKVLLDGFIMLYRVGLTPYSMFRQAMEEIGENSILGAVLNGVEVRSDRYYQKYYGSYYHRKPTPITPEKGTVDPDPAEQRRSE